MNRGLFVTGTDTGVGKTVVASVLAPAIARRLHAGARVALWKPVQTGAAEGSPQADSNRLVSGSGLPIDEPDISTYTFPDPVVPWMAAQREGSRISFAQLTEEGRERLNANDYTVVEGSGGLAVPLTDRHLTGDLAAALDLPLLIVARPGVGSVNHTLLTLAYARGLGLRPIGVVLNGYREGMADIMLENAMMIERFGDVPIVGKLPWLPAVPTSPEDWDDWRERWAEIVDADVDVERLL
ncbi:dethiobiotin synthase [Paenibacillus sp. TRM 82003]|nr:dethiobiotin synthase [Paenibacillus sp. TRM 82003]